MRGREDFSTKQTPINEYLWGLQERKLKEPGVGGIGPAGGPNLLTPLEKALVTLFWGKGEDSGGRGQFVMGQSDASRAIRVKDLSGKGGEVAKKKTGDCSYPLLCSA